MAVQVEDMGRQTERYAVTSPTDRPELDVSTAPGAAPRRRDRGRGGQEKRPTGGPFPWERRPLCARESGPQLPPGHRNRPPGARPSAGPRRDRVPQGASRICRRRSGGRVGRCQGARYCALFGRPRLDNPAPRVRGVAQAAAIARAGIFLFVHRYGPAPPWWASSRVWWLGMARYAATASASATSRPQ